MLTALIHALAANIETADRSGRRNYPAATGVGGLRRQGDQRWTETERASLRFTAQFGTRTKEINHDDKAKPSSRSWPRAGADRRAIAAGRCIGGEPPGSGAEQQTNARTSEVMRPTGSANLQAFTTQNCQTSQLMQAGGSGGGRR